MTFHNSVLRCVCVCVCVCFLRDFAASAAAAGHGKLGKTRYVETSVRLGGSSFSTDPVKLGKTHNCPFEGNFEHVIFMNYVFHVYLYLFMQKYYEILLKF